MSSQSEPHTRLTIAAPFPAHFFLENIAVRQDNSMLITVVQPKELYYLPPPRADAEVEPVLLHTFDELTTGIAELEPDVFVVFTTNAYTTHENYMHRLDLRGWTLSAPAKPELIFTFPKATIALNGCCALSPKTVLAADSMAGLIWRVDFTPDGSPQTKIWLKHESMAHIEDKLPPPPQPGINGVRYSAKEEHVYYTTTGQKLFMRVRVDPNTFEPAGGPERVASGGMYDDFCIDDERGVAYLTVHRENRIDRVPLEPTGEPPRAIVGEPLDEVLLGPSSAAWSRAPSESGRVVHHGRRAHGTASRRDCEERQGSADGVRLDVWRRSVVASTGPRGQAQLNGWDGAQDSLRSFPISTGRAISKLEDVNMFALGAERMCRRARFRQLSGAFRKTYARYEPFSG